MDCWVGFDIGGTKCAVCTGVEEAGAPRVLDRREIATPAAQAEAMERMCGMALDMTAGCRVLAREHRRTAGPRARRAAQSAQPARLERRVLDGADCRSVGRPPLWKTTPTPAPWLNGGGVRARGCRSMAFLTFGTGLGAGLILDGRL